ncbi:MAG: hypothetical protein P1P82_14260 [Bacteroidales bacterium]|nr:hypothetical protein [Bacteroidales bacterium]MDT8432204.1 hypothetical protein [Bacteroidales bacterium]
MRSILILMGLLMSVWVAGQDNDSLSNLYNNSADNLLLQDSRLVIGGYGEVHYNQPLDAGQKNIGMMDVHRVIMLLGYHFNEKTQFVSELEFEHVSEVYVEQAFLQYKLNRYLNFRGGLMLVPMGIVNEYHEPTTFNGVERPVIDKYITPTTWREIGFGVTGVILPVYLKYQAYVMNGFNGYDGSANLNGKNGLRSGRQKGAESFISAPNFTGKVEFFGVRGLNVGLSAYLGNTSSTLYDGVDKSDAAAMARADSSVVGIAMVGLDSRYSLGGVQLRGQLYYAGLSNTDQYNVFAASPGGGSNDLGSALSGYYIEAGYNMLRSMETEKQLVPFVRYEQLNTQANTEEMVTVNPAYKKTVVTTGLTFALTSGSVVKADVQLIRPGATGTFSTTFNAGIGVMF